MVDAPTEAIGDVVRKHAAMRQLFDNGWLHLLAMRTGGSSRAIVRA
jgi:uncharacterized protein YbcC (UPF0753/DUF2309 family)